MGLITFGDLKTSALSQRINLCPDDPRFADAINRLMQWFMLHGSWWGTEVDAEFTTENNCLVTPGIVESVTGVYNGCQSVTMRGSWFRFLPGSQLTSTCGGPVNFSPFGRVATHRGMKYDGLIVVYTTAATDVGKVCTVLGYDSNKIWVRTVINGIMSDGEQITLTPTYVKTKTTFSSITGFIKPETDDRLIAYYQPTGQDGFDDLSVYEYWERRPDYQRYKLSDLALPSGTDCCTGQTVRAKVKLNYIPVKRDDDLLLISNLPAIELGLEALRAKDDGDFARADALFFGTPQNTRFGAIPLLRQEQKSKEGDNRFEANVRMHGSRGFHRVIAGFN